MTLEVEGGRFLSEPHFWELSKNREGARHQVFSRAKPRVTSSEWLAKSDSLSRDLRVIVDRIAL
eukprot:3369685-Rhodomonas_salina.2